MQSAVHRVVTGTAAGSALPLLLGIVAWSLSAPAWAGPIVADSINEWSATGTQGESGWTNGYYNLTDDDGTYESSEKYSMTGDVGDSDCTDGRLYEKTLTLAANGDGELKYRFFATDGYEAADGDPTHATNNTVEVLAC